MIDGEPPSAPVPPVTLPVALAENMRRTCTDGSVSGPRRRGLGASVFGSLIGPGSLGHAPGACDADLAPFLEEPERFDRELARFAGEARG